MSQFIVPVTRATGSIHCDCQHTSALTLCHSLMFPVTCMTHSIYCDCQHTSAPTLCHSLCFQWHVWRTVFIVTDHISLLLPFVIICVSSDMCHVWDSLWMSAHCCSYTLWQCMFPVTYVTCGIQFDYQYSAAFTLHFSLCFQWLMCHVWNWDGKRSHCDCQLIAAFTFLLCVSSDS